MNQGEIGVIEFIPCDRHQDTPSITMSMPKGVPKFLCLECIRGTYGIYGE